MLTKLFGRDTRRMELAAHVPAGTRVYAIGDSHGRVDQLRALHRLILADRQTSMPVDRQVVVYLGDYIDRGEHSKELVELLVNEPLEEFERVHLMGNHEVFLLQFLRQRSMAMSWLMNGGDATCRSYGVDPARPPQVADRLGWLQDSMIRNLPDSHRQFLESLVLSHVEGDYLFVHAGIRPGVPLDTQEPQDLMWIREPFLSSRQDYGKVVVHGHTPSQKPVDVGNRIGIDTGACYGGVLTALVLENDSRRYLYA